MCILIGLKLYFYVMETLNWHDGDDGANKNFFLLFAYSWIRSYL